MRVLAIDDNATNRKVIPHYLAGWGVRCSLSSGASEAIDILRAAADAGECFDLVLLDFQMPEMDGGTLAGAIHAEHRLAHIPMILLTSMDRRRSREELAAVGIVDVLTKPIRQHELLESVLRIKTPAAGFSLAEPEPLAGAAERSEVAGAKSVETESAAQRALRVLVAEDNPVNQRLTCLQLRKIGFAADIAANGFEVLEALERGNYDVILMDCQMPELDGYETTRRIRESGRHASIRIIAMTANAMQGDRDKCLAIGMDDYLSKPTRVGDLRAALNRSAAALTPADASS
jgi:CheY-like chemotaxis protein